MDEPRKLSGPLLWILLTALVVGLAALGERVYDRHVRNYVVLENSSGRTVQTLRIQIGADELSLGPLAPGESRRARFGIDRDSGIVVDGSYADGDLLHIEGGYLTPGYHGERVRLSFLPDGSVRLQQ